MYIETSCNDMFFCLDSTIVSHLKWIIIHNHYTFFGLKGNNNNICASANKLLLSQGNAIKDTPTFNVNTCKDDSSLCDLPLGNIVHTIE